MKNMKNTINPEKNICHDCKKKIEIENGEIKNGVSLTYETADGKITVFKCSQCFEKSKELRNYQPCEVYSRIVGYLRPVRQWNEGKQEEFKDRKEFKLAS
jgi:anaerobic ribonucleoside-triphosphate reductase